MEDFVPYKTRISRDLRERMEAAAERHGMTPSEFVQVAVENEIKRQNVVSVREEIAMLEINQRILAEGEEVPVTDDPLSTEQDRPPICELCQRELPLATEPIKGPRFCGECLELARGGDFRRVTIEP